MIKKVVLSGTSKGIGRAIAQRLLLLGYEVIGLSRSCDAELLAQKNFTHYRVDLSNVADTIELCRYLQKESVYMLINCAGFGRFEPHEELSSQVIADMVALNLTAPMLLSNAVLRSIKKEGGFIVNINSIEALRSAKFAGVYSATKSGLKAFGDSLFEETRKSNMSVVNINPDMTQSSFYDELRFSTSKDEEQKLLASDIADLVEHIVSMRKGAVVSEYTIRSLKFGIVKK